MTARLRIITPLLAILLATGALADELSLRDCLDEARQGNPELRVALHERRSAAEGVRLATSSMLPRVDLQAGYTMQSAPQAVKFGGLTQETQQREYPFAGAGLYQTIYDFGRSRSREEGARFQAKAAAFAYGNLEQDVALQVIRAYYAILHGERLLQVARDEVSQREKHRGVALALFEEGVTTRNDLLQAEVRLSASRQRLLAAESSLQNAWLILNYLTGAPPGRRCELAREEFPPPPPAGYKPAEERRDIFAQRELVQSAESTVAEIGSGFYPEIYLKAGIDYLQNDRVVEQSIVSATVGLKFNLYDGLATTTKRRQATEQLQRERERLKGMEAAAGLELETARNDLEVAARRIEAAGDSIRQGEENLRINTDRYQSQVGTASDVVDAQTLLSQARGDYYQALYDLQVARARVLRAAGEL